jgi:hypothetical protein
MAKAFDRVSWSSLLRVIHCFDFNQHVLALVQNYLSNCWFSALINGQIMGFFKSTMGLRQIDPLSPTLFILALELLSRQLNHTMLVGKFLPNSVPKGCPHDPHCGYTTRKLESISLILSEYQRICQLVSSLKSTYVISSKSSQSNFSRVQHILRFSRKIPLFTYLGCSLFKG